MSVYIIIQNTTNQLSFDAFISFFQINLNISVGEEQVLVNDIPVELSGVTRFNCQALLCKLLARSPAMINY